MKEEKTKTIRKSNYELMRIVSMIGIILCHSLRRGNLFTNTSPLVSSLLQFLDALTFVHVNSFILVTGFFQCDQKFHWKKVFLLIGQMWFYKIFFVLLFSFFGILDISKVDLLREFLPWERGSYWFISCYILLYVMSPFLNILIKNMTQKQHRTCIILLLIFICLIPTITVDRALPNSGYHIDNFILLYLIGAYLKKYPLKENFHFQKFSHNKTQCILFCSMILVALINWALKLIGQNLLLFPNEFVQDFASMLSTRVMLYCNPLMVLQSILYFLWFGTLRIQSNKINKLATLMFGVYLFHENTIFRQNLYVWTKLDLGVPLGWKQAFFRLFVTVCLIFVAGCLFEWIRKKVAIYLSKRKCVQKISNSIKKYIEEY